MIGAKNSVLERLLGNADKFTDKQVAETLDMLVRYGAQRGASDIHIEPHERFVLVRYRIDGLLQGVHKLPRPALGLVMAQLKKLANLDTQTTHAPQEGEFTTEIDGRAVEVRLATMPVYGGEKAVLHLSLALGEPMTLASLGFWGDNLRALQIALTHPRGLIMVAGPRHNGISSTLFSLLSELNSPMLSVATIETHAKHRLPGVTHSYTGKTGLTTLEGLQAALKQDPNVLLLGDLPDGATAQLAAQTAATGHLVLTGLRADSSVAAVLRLRAAGVEPFVLVSAWRAGVGQRLVRRLCSSCRERYPLEKEELQALQKHFGINGPNAYDRLHQLEQAAHHAGIGESGQLSSTPRTITHLWRVNPEGCARCEHTGYQGRTAIVEVLGSTPGLHKGLMDRSVVSVASLQALLVKDGFVPLALDGLVKALRGELSVEDLLSSVVMEVVV